jgi:hypothetical protein
MRAFPGARKPLGGVRGRSCIPAATVRMLGNMPSGGRCPPLPWPGRGLSWDEIARACGNGQAAVDAETGTGAASCC